MLLLLKIRQERVNTNTCNITIPGARGLGSEGYWVLNLYHKDEKHEGTTNH